MKTLVNFFIAGMLFLPSMVYAGAVAHLNVEIDLERKSARGLMKTARFSDDPEELIGCGARHTLNEGGELNSWAFCQAQIGPENWVVCITFNPELIDRIAEINHYSYVQFRWDENDECTHFGYSTQSFHIPEKVGKKPALDE